MTKGNLFDLYYGNSYSDGKCEVFVTENITQLDTKAFPNINI